MLAIILIDCEEEVIYAGKFQSRVCLVT